MPSRQRRNLTAAFVKTCNVPGRYGSGRGGFGLTYVVFRKQDGTLSRRFEVALTIDKGRNDGSDLITSRGIGEYPFITLKKARKIAKKWTISARKGTDPKNITKPAKLPIFRVAAEELIPKELNQRVSTRNRDLQSVLDRYINPAIGSKRLDKISQREIYEALLSIRQTIFMQPDIHDQHVRRIFDQYAALNPNFSNPVTPQLLNLLPKNMRPKEPLPALHYHLLPSLMESIDNHPSRTSTAVRGTLKTIALTGLRLSSAVQGEWSEIRWKHIQNPFDWDPAFGWEPVDWDEAAAGSSKSMIWTIPASRMKGKRIETKPHRIPVSSALLKVLLDMRQLIGECSGDPRYIFPSNVTNSSISSYAPSDFMGTLALPSDSEDRNAVLHGLRATLRNWCADVEVPHEVAELALAHKLSPIVRAYLRSDLAAQRARLMQAWGDCAEGLLRPDWSWVETDPKMITLHTKLDELRTSWEHQVADLTRQLTVAEQRAVRAENRADHTERQLAKISRQLEHLSITKDEFTNQQSL